MANFFSKLFNSEKKDTTYSGPKPYGSLLEANGGPEYYNTIKARMGGQGVGYSDGYTDKASNPVIARMRNQFTSYDLPELKSELTATGRRAGSSGFGQISKAYENQGLNEEAAYAPIYAANEEAKRGDINDSISKVGAFNQGDYNARGILSNFEYADNQRQVNEASQRRANEAAGLQNMVYAGADAASTFLGGGNGIGQRQPQQVNYGGQNYPTSQPVTPYMQNIFARSAQPAKYGQSGGYR